METNNIIMKKSSVLSAILFISAALFFLIGGFLWNRSRVLVKLTMIDPGSLAVSKQTETYLIPVKLTNSGYADVKIVGFNGY